MSRFLRPSHLSGTWEVHEDGERIGSVIARSRGSVLEYVPIDRRGQEITKTQLPRTLAEPLFDLKAAGRAVAQWVADGRAVAQQVAYERSNGWSTD